MKVRLCLFVAIVLSLSLVFVACTTPEPAPTPTPTPSPTPTPAPTPTPHPKVDIELMGSTMGQASYVVHAAAADILTKYHPWIRASVTETTGAPANIVFASEKDPATTIFHMAGTTYWGALTGQKPFEKEYTNIGWIASFLRIGEFLVTLDPNIKTPADMEGKTIGLFPEPWGSTQAFLLVLKEWGIHDKVTVEHMRFGALCDGLKDGLLDVVMVSATTTPGRWSPVPAFADLIVTRGSEVHVIGMDEESLTKAYAAYGYDFDYGVMPPLSFGPNQTEPVGALIDMSAGLACWDATDVELVYEITKTLAEQDHRFREYHASMGSMITKATMVEWLPKLAIEEDDVHPGALKYYQEAGLWPEAFKK